MSYIKLRYDINIYIYTFINTTSPFHFEMAGHLFYKKKKAFPAIFERPAKGNTLGWKEGSMNQKLYVALGIMKKKIYVHVVSST